MRGGWLFVVVVALCALSPAKGLTSSRISLELRHVTLKQAATALEEASGQRIRVPLDDAPATSGLPEVRDFRWRGITFGRALREICVAFHAGCGRDASTYYLTAMPRGGGEQPISRPTHSPTFCVHGASISLIGVDWVNARRFRPPGATPTMLGLDLLAEFEDRDGSSVIGVENLVAQDDRGNLLTCQGEEGVEPPRQPPWPFPDQWRGTVKLPYADLRARKLVWLQGDLFGYRTPSRHESEAGSRTRLFTFRLKDIRLPAPPASVPTVAAPPPLAAAIPVERAEGTITRALENASLSEVVDALNQMGRGYVSVCDRPEIDIPGEGARLTVHWKEMPFGRALREVCSAFELTCTPDDVGFRLTPGVRPFHPSTGWGFPAFQDRNLRVFSARTSRLPAFQGRPSLLSVELPCEFQQVDADCIAGFANVVAKDDRGNLIACFDSQAGHLPFSYSSDPFPDRWTGRLEFPLPDQQAKKLVWLEGDVLVYQRPESSVFELPFVTGAPGVRLRVGRRSFDVECFPSSSVDHVENEDVGVRVEARWLPEPDFTASLGAEVVGGMVSQLHPLDDTGKKAAVAFLETSYPISRLRLRLQSHGPAQVRYRSRIRNLPVPPIGMR